MPMPRKNKEGGRLSSIRPLSTPHPEKLLEIAIFRRALELHFGRSLGRRRNPWLGIIGHHLTIRRRDQSNRALGIITPAVGIGIFLPGMMEATYLIFQTGAIMLIDN